jgi:hypothetical protein
MKLKITYLALCVSILTLLVGCANVGQMSGQTGTIVSLEGKNYKLVKAGAMGRSSGFRLLGIIPITEPNYAGAKASLYKSVDQPLIGRAIALANQTKDETTLYLILFSIPRVTITADVIEFVDPASGGTVTTK